MLKLERTQQIAEDVRWELENQFGERVEKEIIKMKEEAWASDIAPEAYYTEPVEKLAKERTNYSEKMEHLNDLLEILDISPEHLIDWFESKREFAEDSMRKYIIERIIEETKISRGL